MDFIHFVNTLKTTNSNMNEKWLSLRKLHSEGQKGVFLQIFWPFCDATKNDDAHKNYFVPEMLWIIVIELSFNF